MFDTRYSERVDSYSFAIVMWEFLTREWAFDGLEVEEIIECVRDEKERPDVPDWCPRSFRTLLTECWSETPLFRPSFEMIARRLDVLLKVCLLGSPNFFVSSCVCFVLVIVYASCFLMF